MVIALAEAVRNLGVPDEAFVNFQQPPSARHIRYLDLVHKPAAGPNGPTELLPDGVVEASGKPAVYVIRKHAFGGNGSVKNQLADLTRTLACRADAAYLAVIEPGSTTVYRLAFYRAGIAPQQNAVIRDDSAAGLRSLLNGVEQSLEVTAPDQTWLDDLLFQLLTRAADKLRKACSASVLSNGALLSFIGRALFTRFLVDRDIAGPNDVESISRGVETVDSLFASVDSVVRTFTWLDLTFNGDLLDVGTRDYQGLLMSLGPAATTVCQVLSDIMARAPEGQLSLDWGGLRFRHIPVDVLSQVYEHFAHRYTPDTAYSTSIHYTPRSIAELLVDGVFSATPAHIRHEARVMDPAVGAGVFLVLAFRRLVAERWLATGARPKRAEIRHVLTDQLCGLDVNAQSIKVAALSLYLAALELDPDPQPLSELRFERLFDTTLRCVDNEHLHNAADSHLGSLSTQLLGLGPFDIVLGNPPWTALAGHLKPLLDAVPWSGGESPSRSAKSLVPNQWPDLAFLWRSTQWCKPGGVIGLLVHARLLFSQDTFAVRARFFSITRVTGVLNGTALRKAKNIWPSNTQPFCAVVAINEPSSEGDTFYLLTPRHEPKLGQHGDFRLDPKSAIPVPTSVPITNNIAFKALSRGSALDLELIDRLRRAPRMTLEEFLRAEHLMLKQGFIAGKTNLQDAGWLGQYPVLGGKDQPQFAVKTSDLPTLAERYPGLRLHRPREEPIYTGPLLLFREAPKAERALRGALLVDGDLAFSRSFYGVTIGGQPRSQELANYLYVLSYGDLLAYWTLMTSSKFGVERDIYNRIDFDNFPVVPYDALPQSAREQAQVLAAEIQRGCEPWRQVEAFIAKLYRLSAYDLDLIADALAYESPYTISQARGLQSISADSGLIDRFAARVEQVVGQALGADAVSARTCEAPPGLHGWRFIRVTHGQSQSDPGIGFIGELVRRSEEPFMSSQIQVELGDQDWLIGRLSHERYWTKTQARLLALSLLEHGMLSRRRAAA